MLSEEEKKAIERLNEILKEWQEIVNIEDKTEREIEMSLYMEDMPFEEIKIVLNLITKLQKENKEKDKQINELVKYVDNNNYVDNEECQFQYDFKIERCIEKGDCKNCIKSHFEKITKEKEGVKDE